MMWEFFNELESGKGPVFLKLDHLAEETISSIETILHTNERPSRGRFHDGRGTNYRQKMIEMHISEIGFCSGHSASGVWVNEKVETTVPGLYSAGDMANVPHNYMLGAFAYGWFAGENSALYCGDMQPAAVDQAQIDAEKARIAAPLACTNGIPPNQLEYKLRRMVNDYLQPPKVTRKMEIAIDRFGEIGEDIQSLSAANPHELMRALEVQHIYDCAQMAAHASLYRKESRWGLYHYRVDYPERDDENWFAHCMTRKAADGRMESIKRPVEPYILPLDDDEKTAYARLRIVKEAASA